MKWDEDEWWHPDVDSDKRHELLYEYTRDLENAQREIHERHLQNAWLYDHCTLMGVNAELREPEGGPWADHLPSENIIQSAVDTAVAILSRQRSKAGIVTDGADWSRQRNAKMLDRYLEAEFHRTRIWEDGTRAVRDGGVLGLGGLKIYRPRNGKRPNVERTIADEIVVDENEARDQSPRQLVQRRFVDRNVMKALFPKFAEEIHKANRGKRRQYTTYRRTEEQQVVVHEAWHLPSAPDEGDGRWTMCIEGATLFDEEYTRDEFPFVWFRWVEKLTGWYGRGLAEQLAGIQRRLNKINAFIVRCQDLIAVPRIFISRADAQMLRFKLTNEIGMVAATTSGRPPTFLTPQAVSNEIYEEKERLIRRAYEMAGISEFSAQLKRPRELGVESARALRVMDDMQGGRLASQELALEQMYKDAARHLVIVTKEIAADGGDPVATWNTRNLMQKIPWKEIDLDEDMYTMSVEPISTMSRTYAGRKSEVVDNMAAGIWSQAQGTRLLAHPDTEREYENSNAPLEDIEAAIENLIAGREEIPEPYQDLVLGIDRVNRSLANARRGGAPEDVIDRMQTWLLNAEALMAKATPPPAPAPEQPVASLAPEATDLRVA